MNRAEAIMSAFGIGPAITRPMKNLHLILPTESQGPGYSMSAIEQPKKIPIVFDDDVSARNVKILVKKDPGPETAPCLLTIITLTDSDSSM
jgi:hypothetical protein